MYYSEETQYTWMLHKHRRNMLEINCSTLQFCAHGAYIDHMYFIHDKSTCAYYIGILNWSSGTCMGTILRLTKLNIPRSHIASAIDCIIIHRFKTALIKPRQGRFIDNTITVTISMDTNGFSNAIKVYEHG